MAALLDNPTFAADLQPLLSALIANPTDAPTQQAFVTGLANLLAQWNAPSALASQVIAQNALLQKLLTQFNAIGIRGAVATVAALPAGAAPGDAYFVQASYHLYAFIGGNWVDLGLAGTTPDLTGVSAAGAAALNQRILEQTWFLGD